MISIAFGGALGAVGRYIFTNWGKRHSFYPSVITIINIIGSFLFGWIVMQSSSWTAFLCAGVLGGFTTFSTFVIDFWTLMKQNKRPQAFLYVGISIVSSIVACFIGLLIGGM